MKLSAEQFIGFPKELPDFLFELQFSNTIANQAENIIKYKKIISEPLALLYEALLSTVFDIDGQLETKPSRCISLPYTDRRFSPNVPLKEYMYIRFKQFRKSDNIPGLYFDLGLDYYSYGLRIYKQTSSGAEKLRESIADNPKSYSVELEKAMQSGFAVFGDKYKKDHYQNIKDNTVKELLNRKSFHIGKDVPVGENVFTSKFADEITEGFLAVKDLLELLEV